MVPTSSSPPFPPTSSPASAQRQPLFLTRLPRVFSTLLLVATVTSVISTLAFIGYLLIPLLGDQPRAHFAGLYGVGIGGLIIAEACQILGVATLLVQWIGRIDVAKKPRELVVLLLSLIPYMVIVIFLITLVIYLRARRVDRDSERTRDAGQELREQAVDTLIDAGANISSKAASSPASQVGRKSMQDTISRTVGPVAGENFSLMANGLVVFILSALLLSTVASVGIVIPSKGFAPIQSGQPSSHGAAASTKSTASKVMSGAWKLVTKNSSFVCSTNLNVNGGCSYYDINGILSPRAFQFSGPATVQRNGNTLGMVLPPLKCTPKSRQ